VVRTAAVAGTATAVSNRVSRRQAERWQAQGGGQPMQYRAAAQMPAEPAPEAAPAPAASSTVEQLKELAELKNQGILTDDEFAAQKAKILNG
jgi:hypothetical protein